MESDFSDVAMMSDSIPGQAEHEGIQLTGTEFQAGTNTAVPLKAATMQATRRQPQADAALLQYSKCHSKSPTDRGRLVG